MAINFPTLYTIEKKPAFEAAWQRFQQDFKAGIFLDPSLKLVYASNDL